MSDIEGGWKTWLNARGWTERTYLRGGSTVADMHCTITRIGGGADPGEAPLDRPLTQIDVWGSIGDRHATYLLKQKVRAAIEGIRPAGDGRFQLSPNCVLLGIPIVVDDRFLAIADSTRPRYVLTVDAVATDPTITT